MSPFTPDSSRISDALRDPLSGLGLDLEAVELTPAGKKRVLRVAVDKDGGVTLDDIAEATRAVSRELDDDDLMGEQAPGNSAFRLPDRLRWWPQHCA